MLSSVSVTVTQVEAVIEPNGIGDSASWESTSFICGNPLILPISEANLALPLWQLTLGFSGEALASSTETGCWL
jgi:hypothetical protein